MVCSNAVFVDASRALPEIAKIFTLPSLPPNDKAQRMPKAIRWSAKLDAMPEIFVCIDWHGLG